MKSPETNAQSNAEAQDKSPRSCGRQVFLGVALVLLLILGIGMPEILVLMLIAAVAYMVVHGLNWIIRYLIRVFKKRRR